MTALQGFFVPVVTIFKKGGGAVDYEKIEEHVRYLIGKEVDGLIPLGSTGDFCFLSPEEKEGVLRTVIKACGGKCPVVAGATALTTRECIENSKKAEGLGASAVMIAPPFYLPLSDDEICRHYEQVSGQISLPIVLYNNPLCTGQNVTPSLIARLYDSIKLPYVKESSGNIDAFQNILEKTDRQVKVFMGEEPLALEALFLGATGLIMGLGNGIPEVYKSMLRFMDEGQFEQARSLHMKMLPLYNFSARMHEFGYNSVVKSIMKLRGRGEVTHTRGPLLPLTVEQESSLKSILAQAGIKSE
jgi:4-hydroxy-tetrahydrodipicolinate synthase